MLALFSFALISQAQVTIDDLSVALRPGAVNSDKMELSDIVADNGHYTVTATALEELTWVEGSANTPNEGEWIGLQIQPYGVTDITELEYKTGEHQTEWAALTAADAAEAGEEGEIVWWIDANDTNLEHNIWLRYAGMDESTIQLTVNVIPFIEEIEADITYTAAWNPTRSTWYVKVSVPGEDLDAGSIKSIHTIMQAGVELEEPIALTPDTDKVLWMGVAGADCVVEGYRAEGKYAYKVVRQDDSEFIFFYEYDEDLVEGVGIEGEVTYAAAYNASHGRWYIKVAVPEESLNATSVNSIHTVVKAGEILETPVELTPDTDDVLWLSVADDLGVVDGYRAEGRYAWSVVRKDNSKYVFYMDYDEEQVTGTEIKGIEAVVDYNAVYNADRKEWYIKVTVPEHDLDAATIETITAVMRGGEVLEDPVVLTPDTDKVLWMGVASDLGVVEGYKPEGIYAFRVVTLADEEYMFYFDYEESLVTGVVPITPTIDDLTVALREGAVNSDKMELSEIDVDEAHYTVTATALEELDWVEGSENTPNQGEWFALMLQPEGVTDITELEYKTGVFQDTWTALSEADAAEAGVEGQIVWWIDAQAENTEHNIWLRYAGVEDSEIQLTVIVVPFEEEVEPDPYTVTGKVKALILADNGDDNGDDEGDKEGDYEYLAGVEVSIGDLTAITDENGVYEFAEVLEGEHTLTINHAGYKVYTDEITIDGDDADEGVIELDEITLTPLSIYTLTGIVKTLKLEEDGDDNGDDDGDKDGDYEYLEGVEVNLGDLTATTDENGVYEFTEVLEGEYTLTITHTGYDPYTDEVVLSDELAVEGVITLADIELDIYVPTYTVKGVIYNPEGVLEGATVTLGTESIESSSTGEFAFENLDAGIYTLTVSKEFHVDYTVTIDTEDAVNEVLNLGNIRLTYEGYPFYETFAGLPSGSIPAGWAVEGLGQENWKIMNSSSAGGSAPEMRLSWSPRFNGLSRMVSPVIDPMGNGALRLSFKHYLNFFSNEVSIKVQVSYDEGAWEDLLTFEATASIPATNEEVIMTPSETAQSFRLAWTFEGDANDINNYNFDNVIVEPILAHDLVAIALKGNATPSVGFETIYTVSLQNKGLATEDDYTVRLMTSEGVELAAVNGPEIVSEEVKEVSITWTPGEDHEGPMSMYAEIVLDSDQDLGNNKTSSMNLLVQPEGVIAVPIGGYTGTGSLNIPFNFYYKSSIAQSLYYADEFGGVAGAITSLAYTNSFTNSLEDKAIKIWMGVTDAENMEDGWVNHEDLTLVFDGTMDFPSGVNTIVIPFEVPFIYTGGNLVVYTNRVTDTQYHSSLDKFYTTQDEGSKRTRYAQSDSGVNPEEPIVGSVSDWFSDATFFFVTEGLGSLEGTVTDGTDALEGVEVSIAGTAVKVYTDEDGKYEFPTLMAGTYDISFIKVGYYDLLEEVEVMVGAPTVLDVEMVELPLFTVSGTVTDIKDEALEGAAVTLKGEDTYTTLTDELGAFTFENVFMGDYTLTIEKEGYKTWVETGIAVNAEEADEDGLIDLGSFALMGMMEIIIGEGTTFPPATIPFNFFWKNSFAQTIYYADEINLGAGWIHSVVYTNNFTQTLANKEIRVWIGETDNTNLSDGWVALDGLTKVFDGTITFPIGVNEIEITFDEPYAYNGGNLVIYTNRVWEDGYAASTNKFYATEYADSQRTRHIQADGSAGSNPENPGVGTISHWAPNTNIMIEVDGLADLTGVVKDEDTEAAVEGALITVSNSNVKLTSDESGAFATKLFPGTYTITVSKVGYETAIEMDVVLVADEVTSVAIDLVPLSVYTVTGIAKGNDNVAIEGASVTLTGIETLTTTTNATGVFNFEEILEGTYTISITKEGYLPYSGDMNTATAVAGVVDLGTLTLTEIIVAPFGLMAVVEDDINVRFSWNNPMGFTDDFESYDDFIIADIGDYTLYDGDGSATYGFNGVTFPNSGYVGSYITFNPSAATPALTNEAILPHGGDKFIACFAATSGPNNDWLITPEFPVVNGMKLSFWAKTYMDYGLEKFKIAISTTDTNVSSFDFITGEISVPVANWTYYEYDLSAYAGQSIHAAIVCVSNDVFVFMVDDLTVGMDMGDKANLLGYSVPTLSHYSAAQNVNTRAFTGYKVYLDGELVTPSAIAAEEFLFEGLTPGETYIAGVRSVYTSGESDMETITFTVPVPPVVYTVKGVVKDDEGALANVEVKLDALTTTTGADGAFSFAEVAEGTYTLTINHTGYQPHSEPVNTANAVDGIVDLGDILLIPTGIMDNTLSTLSAYPNPFDTHISITNPELVERVIITNALGQRVIDITLNGESNISTDELGQGVYLITFQGFNGERTVRTMVKQ